MDCWPLFDLRITTPRLELRYANDADIDALMTLAAQGIHDEDLMPFGIPWTRIEPPRLQWQGMQHHWRTRAALSPESWTLPFAVREDGVLVGTQDIKGTSFAVTRAVSTGSWLGRAHQGRGIGKEMRAAVLHLAFDALGAQVAETSAFADNEPSVGVTTSLGYKDNGWWLDDREGTPARHRRFLMERDDWLPRRRDDIEVAGLTPCLPLLGLT
jgi:RimJ/RimL family protein N-acetyltransferase